MVEDGVDLDILETLILHEILDRLIVQLLSLQLLHPPIELLYLRVVIQFVLEVRDTVVFPLNFKSDIDDVNQESLL